MRDSVRDVRLILPCFSLKVGPTRVGDWTQSGAGAQITMIQVIGIAVVKKRVVA